MTTDIYEPAKWRVTPLLMMRRMLHLAKIRGRYRAGAMLLHLMLPRQKCVLPNATGGRMVFDLNNDHEGSMFLDLFAEDLSAVLSRTLRDGDTFIDCGANVGYFTFYAANLVGPQGQVIGIDANPYCAQRITESCNCGEYPQVTVLGSAVSAESGEIKFNIAEDAMYSSVSDLNQAEFTNIKEEIVVPVITLDSLIQQRGLSDQGAVRLVKVDVEGAEIDLLRGARESLENGVIDFVYIEIHDRQLGIQGQSRDELAKLMTDLGYSIVHQPLDTCVVYQSSQSGTGQEIDWNN